MKCELCSSKKNVRLFGGILFKSSYTECRKCFEKAMGMQKRLIMKCENISEQQFDEYMEQEWNRGKERYE